MSVFGDMGYFFPICLVTGEAVQKSAILTYQEAVLAGNRGGNTAGKV